MHLTTAIYLYKTMDDLNTEEKVMEAARRVFVKKGMDGARMQEIADEAGINKALLHYYFRSKDKLLEAVCQDVFTNFFNMVGGVLLSDKPLREKMTVFVDTYLDVIGANPFVPQFIINEANRNPELMRKLMRQSGFDPNQLIMVFKSQIKNPNIDARHLVISLLAMCVFPHAARPLMESVYFNNDSEAYAVFLNQRKAFITDLMMKYLDATDLM